MIQPARQLFTFDEYVELEEISTVKHEFLEGEVWAMAGGTPEHAAIAGNVIRLLGDAVRGQRCRVFSSDLRIRVQATGLGTYPDVSVVCGEVELDPRDAKGHTVTNPSILVEVLSPSTEAYDRGEKVEHYRKIATLREILLIAHDGQRVELWHRQHGEPWQQDTIRQGAVRLPSLGCSLALGEIYFDPLAD